MGDWLTGDVTYIWELKFGVKSDAHSCTFKILDKQTGGVTEFVPLLCAVDGGWLKTLIVWSELPFLARRCVSLWLSTTMSSSAGVSSTSPSPSSSLCHGTSVRSPRTRPQWCRSVRRAQPPLITGTVRPWISPTASLRAEDSTGRWRCACWRPGPWFALLWLKESSPLGRYGCPEVIG